MTDTFVRYHVGDALTVLRTMPDASVDLVLTSPAFLGLRSYLLPDDPMKSFEMGSEGTPGEFLDALLDAVEECRRVLAPHGSIAFELGDTYAGSGGAGGDYNENGFREGQAKFSGTASKARKLGLAEGPRPARSGRGHDWPEDKSLCLIPEMFRFALVYGFNPLTGRETPRWRARNVVRWCRPNPPVGALADKVRPATSDLLIACASRRRYFDLDAIRTAHKADPENYSGNGYSKGHPEGIPGGESMPGNPNGAPPLDHWWFDEVDDLFEQDAWLISTQGYPGSHYAMWPEALCERPIKAMCPTRVCTKCGTPSERTLVENKEYAGRAGGPTHNNAEQGASLKGVKHAAYQPAKWLPDGWTDCGHDSWRAGVVLDPFAGSGTTLAVAHGHGRSAIGVDLDVRNAELARQRVGMFLEVVGESPPPRVKHAGDI